MSTENKLAKEKKRRSQIAFDFFTATSYAIVTSICNISFYCKGIGVISWEFISAMPKNGMTEGGFSCYCWNTLV
jgi:phosphate transport system permease protein